MYYLINQINMDKATNIAFNKYTSLSQMQLKDLSHSYGKSGGQLRNYIKNVDLSNIFKK